MTRAQIAVITAALAAVKATPREDLDAIERALNNDANPIEWMNPPAAFKELARLLVWTRAMMESR